MYLSLKEQECTKQIEKILVVTLHVFRGMYLHFTTAGGVTFSATVNVNKGLAVNAVFCSLFPLIAVLFSIFATK